VARRILGSAWWARFTFNGITRCERGSYTLRVAGCLFCVLKLITGRMARPENELRSDPDLQSLGDCSLKASTAIGCDPKRQQTQPRSLQGRV
jgi:hypothetical protein